MNYTTIFGRCVVHPCSDDEEFILRTNQIDTSVVRTTKEQCFSYFVGQSDKMVINQDYQNVVTDGLVLNLDAGFLPSYPATGDSWYDLSVGGNTGTLANTPTHNVIALREIFNALDYLENVEEMVDFFLVSNFYIHLLSKSIKRFNPRFTFIHQMRFGDLSGLFWCFSTNKG